MKSIVLFTLLYLAASQIPQVPNPLRQKPDPVTQTIVAIEPRDSPENGDFEEVDGDLNFLP